MKKVSRIKTTAMFLAFCTASACAVEAKPGELEKTEVNPLTFNEYKSAVNDINIKEHTMTLAQLEKLHGKPQLVILDLRSEHEYNQGHIKGAINFGPDITQARLEKFVPDKQATVVVYCTNNLFPSRRISLNFASLPQIVNAGYAQSYVLEDLWHSGFETVDKFKAGPLWQGEEKSK